MGVRRKYKTFWSRAGAAFIDGIVLFPLTLLSVWVNGMDGPTIALVFVIVVSRCGGWIYNVLMHGIFGQTVGKWLADIKVLDIHERPINIQKAFIRESFYIVVNVITVAIYIKGKLGTIHDPGATRRIEAFIALTSMLWSLLEIVTTLFNDKRRALHDYIGGTVVVRTEYLKEPNIADSVEVQQMLAEARAQMAQSQISTKTATAVTSVKRSEDLR